ncbi:MAG: DnaD domain protein [Chloroflexi bacterium]|nr:DnaD domain protein [Chloroflexota bacterium]
MPNRQLSSSPVKTDFISLPDSFFTQALPKIQDLAELKIVLYASYLILRKPGHPFAFGHSERSEESHAAQGRPQFVTYKELKAESSRLSAELDEKTLRQALNSAVGHGVLSHSTLKINGVLEDVYSLTIPMYRSRQPPSVNIFALYEQNIGIITPMIAEELKEAEKLYPARWIEEAFKEAVTLNKRSWKYIARILERWASEGKDSGEYKRHVKKGGPDKYIKGKYGHLVKR